MNIFILDPDPKISVTYYVDKHVVKMILEHTQLMCAALHILDRVKTPYKPTHLHHPCTKWLIQSLGNWEYLKQLNTFLNDEYKYRYNHPSKNHKAFDIMLSLDAPKNYTNTKLTPFAQAISEPYRTPNTDAVTAYRKYYVEGKQHLAKWTKREVPQWYMVNSNRNQL